jgi:hypothetical protein
MAIIFDKLASGWFRGECKAGREPPRDTKTEIPSTTIQQPDKFQLPITKELAA